MTHAEQQTGERIGIQRYFTDHTPVYDTVEWDIRDAVIPDHKTGGEAFRQDEVAFPKFWSQNATNIVAQKYFRIVNGVRENSLRQVVARIADTIVDWGDAEGYFADASEAWAFGDELKYLMLHQMAAFNSPVWFNIGVPGAKQQASACYILAVEDDMGSILDWYKEEGIIFKGGSGAGINLSRIRSSHEHLRASGGTASGPVSFMRGADASAGTIKSGGSTRRAAKMVILDIDHPDIEEFVWCKAVEERKARTLSEAGFEMGVNGRDGFSIQYQNANNSVRVTDEFMQAVVDDADWDLKAITSGEVIKTVKARDLMTQIAKAAWECADPGLQFDTTINRWHTSPARGRIGGSNPCSEYVSNDNTSCNLSSMNLMRFVDSKGQFDPHAFSHAVRIMFIAQDIMICRADSPTEKIAEGTKAHRQIGLGYTNLGALLMTFGMPYDSEAGRTLAAAITSLMTGVAYRTSVELASRLGAYPAITEGDNFATTLRVLGMHADEATQLAGRTNGDTTGSIAKMASFTWNRVTSEAKTHGVRNSQATLLAPTGTISFALDCDTTGIEPDFALVKHKALVGGGQMKIVNQAVPKALFNLGYDNDQVAEIIAHIATHETVTGCEVLRPEHVPVFACAVGEPSIDPMGHVKMMGAVQPWLSGAISKTVNMPTEATAEDIFDLYVESWHLGVKCLAVYRDGSKVGQPLSTGKTDAKTTEIAQQVTQPIRRKMPRRVASSTTRFRIDNAKGYMTVGLYDDSTPGEVFIKVAKQGSTLAGFLDSFAIQLSHSLQYREPMADIIKAHLGHRFEPNGFTDDPEIRTCSSIIDYVMRRLAIDYLPVVERADLGVFTTEEKLAESVQITPTTASPTEDLSEAPEATQRSLKSFTEVTAQWCSTCGGQLVRAGACLSCPECGSTSGCS